MRKLGKIHWELKKKITTMSEITKRMENNVMMYRDCEDSIDEMFDDLEAYTQDKTDAIREDLNTKQKGNEND